MGNDGKKTEINLIGSRGMHLSARVQIFKGDTRWTYTGDEAATIEQALVGLVEKLADEYLIRVQSEERLRQELQEVRTELQDMTAERKGQRQEDVSIYAAIGRERDQLKEQKESTIRNLEALNIQVENILDYLGQ